ncbi:PREDICTED: spermatogenesis-associated protein 31E1 [Propithecus coquereli]|uniref:spermatogenesis-associated protein 31E1 n=1 Tax=Propithecus coquereli TaxID=379532 RepID=UPI00063F6512|nr:PREDICTED: spermatogenesis-associated protein 31E1 [Propithecus coquereli]
MENQVFPLKSISATWLSPSSPPWVVDITLGLLCGLGLFLLLLPCLGGDPSPPQLGQERNIRKMGEHWSSPSIFLVSQPPVGKRGRPRSRKKSCALKACRDCRRELEGARDLILLLQSNLEKLPDKGDFHQLSYSDPPGAVCKPPPARAHQPHGECMEDASPATFSTVASPAPLAKHPPPLASNLLPGPTTFPVCAGSHSSLSASQRPEPLLPLECPSPQPRAFSLPTPQSPPPVASHLPPPDASLATAQWSPDKKHLEDVLKVHLSKKLGQIMENRIPVSVHHSRLSIDQALAPPENSNTHTETGNLASSEGRESCEDTLQELLLDAGSQRVLEAHIKRLQVRRRWGLPLKIIKTKNLFMLKKAHPLLVPHSTFPSQATCESGDNSTAEVPNFPEDPREDPGEKVTTEKTVLNLTGPLPVPSPVGDDLQMDLRGTHSGDNCGHTEDPATVQEDRWPSQPLPCRTWHSEMVLGAGQGSPEQSPNPATARNELREEEESVASGDPCNSLALLELTVGSQSSGAKETMEPMEAEEEKSPAWEATLGASVRADSHTLNVNPSSGSLGNSKSSLPTTIYVTQDPEELCLNARIVSECELAVEVEPENQPQGPAPNVFLQDRTTGTILQDCAPDVLATDIWASQPSLSTASPFSAHSKSSGTVVYLEVSCLVNQITLLPLFLHNPVGNVAIISLSILDAHLRTATYFFLRNLSVLNLCFTTSIVPQMLVNMWGENKQISYAGCMVQYWVALALGSTECVLLAGMAVDHYIAVCWPLRYASIMHPRLCHLLVAASWSSGFANSFLQSSMATVLPRCGNQHVDHFFCELLIIVKLSCVDTGPKESKMFIARLIILGIPVSIILTSYVCIARAVVKMRSAGGRKKAFGTCASHLIVVSLFYRTIMFLYLQPKDNYSQDQSKTFAVLYMILTPTLNPLIYTLRNKDLKKAVRKVTGKEQV